MDTVEEYRELIKRIIVEYAAIKPSYGDVVVETIFDEERDHYEMMYAGWNDYHRVHGSVIHIDIRDGKIWIQHDGTAVGIAQEMLDAGIPSSQIVLAFHHPHKRQFTPFAQG